MVVQNLKLCFIDVTLQTNLHIYISAASQQDRRYRNYEWTKDTLRSYKPTTRKAF